MAELKSRRRRADLVLMSSRRFLPALLALATSAPFLLGGCGSSSPVDVATGQIGRADDQATAINLEAAATSLEQSRTVNGTYAGATLTDTSVRLVRADASSYCLESASRTATYHLAGPGGTVALGPC
jgi:lipid-binding SYLF domain-containing protein